MAVAAALPHNYATVKSLLITVLSAAPALAGVEISWSSPSGSAPDEFIMLGDGRFTVKSAAIGSQRREERGTIQTLISVIQSTGDQSLPTLRAFVLYDALASILRQDATLGNGGTAPRWALDGGYDVAELSNGTRSETKITTSIQVAARI